MASTEEALAELKAQRSKLKAKIAARSGQSGYAANVETLKALLEPVNNQIAELEAELAAQAEEQTDGEGQDGTP